MDEAAKEQLIKTVCSFLRGTCPCGKWLVLIPSPKITKENPFVCEGPCHMNKKCGHTYWHENGEWKGSAIRD
jgi:hypothetical protein